MFCKSLLVKLATSANHQLLRNTRLYGNTICSHFYPTSGLQALLQYRLCSNYYKTNPDVAPGAIHNVKSICSKWAEHFKHKNIPEPEVSAELIVAHVLGVKTLAGVVPWQIVPTVKTDQINKLCLLRLERMPVQYIIEEWDFRDLLLEMRPPVLIPRPETEELIGFIHQYQVSNHLSPPEWILDIGCGCGAIILSLCKEYPLSQCIGIDQSPAACDLSRKNANSNSLAVHIENIQFNDDTVKKEKLFHHGFDLIVSNPPYIKKEDLEILPLEIKCYEDVSGALDGGADGLEIIVSILRNTKYLLNKQGLLWLEVDSSHPDKVKNLVENNLDWGLQYIQTYNDFLGKPRFCLLSLH